MLRTPVLSEYDSDGYFISFSGPRTMPGRNSLIYPRHDRYPEIRKVYDWFLRLVWQIHWPDEGVASGLENSDRRRRGSPLFSGKLTRVSTYLPHVDMGCPQISL